MAVRLHVVAQKANEAPQVSDRTFDQPRVSIGRGSDNDLQLNQPNVSRHHAVIFLDQGGFFLEDLRSTHGTLLNGHPLGSGGKKVLQDNDVVQIAQNTLGFSILRPPLADDLAPEKTAVLARRMMGTPSEELDGVDVPYIRVMAGAEEGKKAEIGADVSEVLIGRGPNCTLLLRDVSVSREHALVRREWDKVSIEDLHSKNGVTVNGRRITAVTRLNDGDDIGIGSVYMSFIDPTARIVNKLSRLTALKPEESKVTPVAPTEPAPAVAAPAPAEAIAPAAPAPVAEAPSAQPAAAAGGPTPSKAMPPVPSKPGFGTVDMLLVLGSILVAIGIVAGIALIFL